MGPVLAPTGLLLPPSPRPATVTGLYDHQGILRFAGSCASDCLAYAELFALPAGSFTLVSLEKGVGCERTPERSGALVAA
ncbi:hypothetical protein NZK32_01060 [Cyanobium sp. FGCU-52]|nr:hypothetical protein [Cyanobium sp. FGCU52]